MDSKINANYSSPKIMENYLQKHSIKADYAKDEFHTTMKFFSFKKKK